MFEIRVMGKIHRAKMDKEIRETERNWHNAQFRDLYISSNFIRAIKSEKK